MRNMLLRGQASRQKKLVINFDSITPHLQVSHTINLQIFILFLTILNGQVGDWKLLHILCSNMDPRVFGEFVLELAIQMKEFNKKDIASSPLMTDTL